MLAIRYSRFCTLAFFISRLLKFSSMKTLRMCLAILKFCECFAILLNENLTHAIFFHAACWLLYRPKQAHTFSTLQQSRFWASFTRVSLHAQVWKPSENKKCVQASWGCLQHHNRTFFPTFAKDMNFLQLNTTRIILSTLEGPWGGRITLVDSVPYFGAKTNFLLQKT